MVGLTSLTTRNPPVLPKLNRRRALFVLTKIDEILVYQAVTLSGCRIIRRAIVDDVLVHVISEICVLFDPKLLETFAPFRVVLH